MRAALVIVERQASMICWTSAIEMNVRFPVACYGDNLIWCPLEYGGQRDDAGRKGAYCAWPIHYHTVFSVKYRKALLDEAVTTIIREAAAEIAERFPIEMEAIGMEGNHIHLLGSTPPKVAPGRIVQRFKNITARELFRRNLVVKRVLWRGEFWTDGYDVATVGGAGN